MKKIWHEFKTVDRGERPYIFSAKKPSAFSYMKCTHSCKKRTLWAILVDMVGIAW